MQHIFKTQKQNNRFASLLPGGIPKKIRIYDNGGETFDRFTVVFTGNFPGKTRGVFPYLGMSENPFYAQGFCQHGETQNQPCDRPAYSHLGKKIKWETLPVDCQSAVLDDYLYYWGFKNLDGEWAER